MSDLIKQEIVAGGYTVQYIHQIAVDWSQAEIAYKLMQRLKGMLIPNKNTSSLPQMPVKIWLHSIFTRRWFHFSQVCSWQRDYCFIVTQRLNPHIKKIDKNLYCMSRAMWVGSRGKHIIVVCRCTHLLLYHCLEQNYNELQYTEYFAIMLISHCFTMKAFGAEIHSQPAIHYM